MSHTQSRCVFFLSLPPFHLLSSAGETLSACPVLAAVAAVILLLDTSLVPPVCVISIASDPFISAVSPVIQKHVPQLILSYSKLISYHSILSSYSLLILLSKRKPATEEPLCLLVVSGYPVLKHCNMQLLGCTLFLAYYFLIILLERVKKGFSSHFPVCYCFHCFQRYAIRCFLENCFSQVFMFLMLFVYYQKWPQSLVSFGTALSFLLQISLVERFQLYLTYYTDGQHHGMPPYSWAVLALC